MLGFEEYRHYAIFPAASAPPLHWLQCIEDRTLAFPIVSAETLGLRYAADEQETRCLGAESSDVIEYWVILVLPSDGASPRANLRAPVIVNRSRRIAAQIILREEYPIAESLEECAQRELVGAR